MSTLEKCIDKLVVKHGSLRAAARVAGVDAGYLSRLRSGERDEPSDAMLRALGVERVVTYRLSKRPTVPFEFKPTGVRDFDGDFS